MRLQFGFLLVLSLILASLFLFGPYFFRGADAADEIKTLYYFVGQATSATSTVSWPFTFYIGDDISTSTKSAFFDLSGVSPNLSSLAIDFTLSGGSGTCAVTRTLDTTGRANEFRLLYDVTSCINVAAKGEYSRTLNITFTGGSVDSLSARFLITYQHTPPSNLGSTTMKTLSFVSTEGTATSSVAAGSSTTFNFSIFIGDSITAMKSAFVELSGVSLASASTTLSLTFGGGSGTCPLSRALDTTGQANEFHVLYDVTSCINITAKGSFSRSVTVSVASGGADVNIFSPKLFLTYQFTPPSAGGYPISGTIISPIFDTGAVNGATFNWIKVIGTTATGTKVRAQLATSNSSSGPWTYLGPNCDTSSYYIDGLLTGGSVSQEIGCFSNHHNKRYFRYKAILCSGNCSSAGSATPQVDDVIVNWSP